MAQAISGIRVPRVPAPGPDPCFSTILLKVHRDCNLNCSYCYVYNMADQSWRLKPKIMSAEIIEATASRIQEHVDRHQIAKLDIIFHGGEPLLGGIDYLLRIRDAVRARLGPKVTPSFGMQTNGTLLSESVLDVLHREQIGFGISLDGPPAVNDRFRIYHNGHGSHSVVMDALARISAHPARKMFSGFLAVIHVDDSPEQLIGSFVSLGAERLDLLLPHGTWDHLPPGMPSPSSGKYGRWLIRAFDYWFDRCPSLRLRYFADILKLFFGGRDVVESLGLLDKSIIVIETDGAIEGLDSLRSVREGATNLGLNVVSNSLDEALKNKLVVSRFEGMSSLAPKCQECRYARICGGGYIPHRYSESAGYRNPSVYCEDLFMLCNHVEERLRKEIPHYAS